MRTRLRRDGSVWITLGDSLTKLNRDSLKAEVADILNEKATTAIIIDCAHCGEMDSTGLGALVVVSKRDREAGVPIYLTGLSADLRDLFELTKLDTLFRFYEHPSFGETRALILPAFAAIDAEVMSYVAKHPNILSELHWRDFERLLEAIFKNQGFDTELGTGYSDHGIDLRLIRNDSLGAVITVFQAKRYGSHRPIRLEAVQAFCALIDDERANRGLFVTTSRYLPSARSFASRQGRRIQLADSTDVAKWCNAVARVSK